jgi:hypothetical protein
MEEAAAVVDAGLVELKLHELDRYLTQLSRHRGVTAADLDKNLDKVWIVQHGLQLIIQCPGYRQSHPGSRRDHRGYICRYIC